MADIAGSARTAPRKDTNKTPEGGGKQKHRGKKSPASVGDGTPGSSGSAGPRPVVSTVTVEASGASTVAASAGRCEGGARKKEAAAQELPAEKSKNKQEKQKKLKAVNSKLQNATPPETGDGVAVKSKAQLKAERRAIQEAQRAAKDTKKAEVIGGAAAASGGGGGQSAPAGSGSGAVTAARKENSSRKDGAADSTASAAGGASGKGGTDKKSKRKRAQFDMQSMTENQMWIAKEKEILVKDSKIDNNILNLGFQFFHHNIVGANARCMALLTTLKEVIAKYRTPQEKELSRDLEKNFLTPCISYINYCRPLSTSMGNAIKHLKHHINRIPSGMDDETAIAKLQGVIDNFIYDNIKKAAEAVAMYAALKIDDDDVILIYAASSLIAQVLTTAYEKAKNFRVIVVEGRPRTEGKVMLKYLVQRGIPCSYVYIGSASHAMNEATKVFLGAAAMFAIGDMHSRTGNSMIAALAKACNVPVLVCCETYKFTDKVQFHSTDSNLHARGYDVISIGHMPPIIPNYEEIGLHLLNLMYDVTQSRYITALVTELGMLPCTSVPVVLRRQEDLVSDGALV